MERIRFWHYHNGSPVKITLAVGQSLFHSQAWATDEGWTRDSNEWEFDGETLVSIWECDGVDCDGRLTQSGVSYCSRDMVRAGYNDTENGVSFPAWVQGKSQQRDYSAEAAGY